MAQAIRQLGETTILRKLLDVAIAPAIVVVKGVAANSVKLPTAADVTFMGVTLENGAIAELRDIAIDGGIVACTAGAAIAEGDLVSIHGTTGKIKTAAPATGANSFIVGVAMQAAAADGDIIGVLLARAVMQGA